LIDECGKVSSIVIIESLNTKRLPDDDVRKRSAEMADALAPHVLGAAQVIELEGLMAGAVRAYLSGIALLARGGIKPTKVFRHVEDAVRWVCGLPEQVPEVATRSDDLTQAVVSLQRRRQPAAP
jgi:hypothetical protein